MLPHRTQATRLCRSCLRALERRRYWSSLSEASASPALAQAGQWTLLASSPSAASYAQQLQQTSSSALRDHTLLAGARTPPPAANESSGAFFTPSYYARAEAGPPLLRLQPARPSHASGSSRPRAPLPSEQGGASGLEPDPEHEPRLPPDKDADAGRDRKRAPGDPGPEEGVVNEHEYRIRLGRAVHLLRATLSNFMATGLVDYPDALRSDADEEQQLQQIRYGFPLRDEGVASGSSSSFNGREVLGMGPPSSSSSADLSIYHPSVKFCFHAPLGPGSSSSAEPHSSAEEQQRQHQQRQLSFSGRGLYLTSSQVLRTALKALFSSATVEIERIHLVGGGGAGRPSANAGPGRLLRSPPRPRAPVAPGEGGEGGSTATQGATGTGAGLGGAGGGGGGADELLVRLVFRGLVRVTHYAHEYTAVFRYTFDPQTGQIVKHAVEKIQPAPGRKIWAGFLTALKGARFGLGWHLDPHPMPHPQPAPTSSVHMQQYKPAGRTGPQGRS